MHKPIIISLFAATALCWAQPVKACGMYMGPRGRQQQFEQQEPDVSKLLLVRARAFEQHGETRSALRLYERVMRDDVATKVRRAAAAIAAYRIHRTLGDEQKASDRLRLALELNPRDRLVQLSFGAEMVGERPREAELALRRALLAGLRGTQRADAHALLAEALARQGKLMTAAEFLSAAQRSGASDVLVAKARIALDGRGDRVYAQGSLR